MKLIFALATYKTRVKSKLRKIIQDGNASICYLRSENRLALRLGIMYIAFLPIEIWTCQPYKGPTVQFQNLTKHNLAMSILIIEYTKGN